MFCRAAAKLTNAEITAIHPEAELCGLSRGRNNLGYTAFRGKPPNIGERSKQADYMA